ncbi:MAG: ABC transporter permease [Clostridiaceae bacterium]
MINYARESWQKLGLALLEHLEMVGITLVIALLIAALLTVAAMYSKTLSNLLITLFSIIYAVPSLALFAILIPLTGLGRTTAIIVLVLYSQYILLRNFIAGLNEVNPSVIEAATGIGMTTLQILYKIRLPLSLKALFTGIRLMIVSTVGIATIAAFINAGGLGVILYEGLRTMNLNKILWGSLLSAGLALGLNGLLAKLEKTLTDR